MSVDGRTSGSRRLLPVRPAGLSWPEPDVPLDRCGRCVDADRPHLDRVAEVPAEGRMHLEKLADLRAEHLRHRLARRLRGTTEGGTRGEAPGELDHQLVDLDTKPFGPSDVRELLGLLELCSQVVEPRPVLPASAMVRRLLECSPRGTDR